MAGKPALGKTSCATGAKQTCDIEHRPPKKEARQDRRASLQIRFAGLDYFIIGFFGDFFAAFFAFFAIKFSFVSLLLGLGKRTPCSPALSHPYTGRKCHCQENSDQNEKIISALRRKFRRNNPVERGRSGPPGARAPRWYGSRPCGRYAASRSTCIGCELLP
jgi:hypothetical protein